MRILNQTAEVQSIYLSRVDFVKYFPTSRLLIYRYQSVIGILWVAYSLKIQVGERSHFARAKSHISPVPCYYGCLVLGC
ncbi:MAG TPA: hypothetical protein V6D15_16160 [Oculatellaceae cyanobacterium]